MGHAWFRYLLRDLFRKRMVLVVTGLAVLFAVGWTVHRVYWDGWRPSRVLGESVGEIPLAFSPDGTILVARTQKNVQPEDLKPWRLSTGKPGAVWIKDGPRFGLATAFSPDGKTLATTVGGINAGSNPTSKNVQVVLIDVATGQPRLTWEANATLVYRLGWARDGGSLHAALGSSAFTEVVTWDAATGRELASWPISYASDTLAVGFSPDGKTLAEGRAGPGLDLWDLEHNRVYANLETPSSIRSRPHGIDYTPDGQTLIVSRDDGSVGIWDLPTRKLVKTIPVFPSHWWFDWIELAPDGRTFVAVTHPKPANSPAAGAFRYLARKLFGWVQDYPKPQAVLVDIASGQKLGQAEQASHPVYSPDSRTIAVHDEQRGIVLYPVPIRP